MHMYIAAPVYKRASNILDWNLRDDFCFSLKAIKMKEKFSKMLQLHKKVWGEYLHSITASQLIHFHIWEFWGCLRTVWLKLETAYTHLW